MGRVVRGELALVLILVACGGDADGAVPPPPTADVLPPTTAPPPTTVAPTTTTTVAPTTTTTVAPTTTTTAPASQPYVVVEGDTLVSIASRFGSSAQQLAELNRLPDPRRLQVGQTLAIPVPSVGAAAVSG